MDIDIDQVAALARLELTSQEKEALSEQLRSILAHVDQLSNVDTAGVEATRHPIPLATPLRDDVVGVHLSHEESLSNAPESDGESVIVPRVV